MTLARRFIWSFLHNHADGKIHPGSKKFSGDLSYEKKNNDFQIKKKSKHILTIVAKTLRALCGRPEPPQRLLYANCPEVEQIWSRFIETEGLN